MRDTNNAGGVQSSDTRPKVKTPFSEMLRRVCQLFVMSWLFNVPPLLYFRRTIYRRFCDIGSGTLLADNVLFYSPHDLVYCQPRIGSNCQLAHHVEIDCSGQINIEDEVWISPHVKIFSHDHDVSTRQLKSLLPISRHHLRMGRDAWIGEAAIILPQVTSIGAGAIIGAGSVVTSNVEDYVIVAGNPARLIRHRRET